MSGHVFADWTRVPTTDEPEEQPPPPPPSPPPPTPSEPVAAVPTLDVKRAMAGQDDENKTLLYGAGAFVGLGILALFSQS